MMAYDTFGKCSEGEGLEDLFRKHTYGGEVIIQSGRAGKALPE